MRWILAATGFSVRSHRSLRRTAILAQETGAEGVLSHVIDDDQHAPMVEPQSRAAAEQLTEVERTLRLVDGVKCRTRISLGPPFAALAHAAEALDVNLIVLGPQRRQLLRDVFICATAERTVRIALRPAMMANGIPAGTYRRILLAAELPPDPFSAIRADERIC